MIILVAGLFTVSISAKAAELLAVMRPQCPYCKAWEIEVGQVYDRTQESGAAPLRRIDIGDVRASPYLFKEPVRYTPTFVLMDRNVEVGRIVGYSDEAMFWGLLGGLLGKIPGGQD
jgi:Thioredoxin-like domain